PRNARPLVSLPRRRDSRRGRRRNGRLRRQRRSLRDESSSGPLSVAVGPISGSARAFRTCPLEAGRALRILELRSAPARGGLRTCAHLAASLILGLRTGARLRRARALPRSSVARACER